MNVPTKGTGLPWVGRAIRRVEDPALLAGRGPDSESFRAAAEAAADAVEPMEDIHADAEFRLDLVRAVTRRALERAHA